MATSIITVSPLLVPGLLQTSAYARAIMVSADVPESGTNTRVSVRVGRRDAITRSDSPASLAAFIWEPVLRQTIGSPDAMSAEDSSRLITGMIDRREGTA